MTTALSLRSQMRLVQWMLLAAVLLLAALAVPRAYAAHGTPVEAQFSHTVLTRSLGLHAGPAHGYNVVGKVFDHQTLTVSGRNHSNTWLYVSSGRQSGWLPARDLQTTARTTRLPVVAELQPGATLKPTVYVVQPHLGIRSGADWNYNVIGMLLQNQEVIVMARNADASWYFIWSNSADGWVPAAATYTAADVTALPVWSAPIQGAQLKPTGAVRPGASAVVRQGAAADYTPVTTLRSWERPVILARNAAADWVFVWSDAGDGWVRAADLLLTTAVDHLPVWTDHFQGATRNG